jgi:hypothetical protein
MTKLGELYEQDFVLRTEQQASSVRSAKGFQPAARHRHWVQAFRRNAGSARQPS